MTDYHPLIARAVDGLAKNTGEARRALYERARSALVAQLRSVEPALSESDITKERLALEEAIRKVESEAARKALAEPRPQPRAEPRVETRPAPRQPFAETRPRTAPDPEPRRDRINSTAATCRLPRRPAPPLRFHHSRPAKSRCAKRRSGRFGLAAKPSARSRLLGARTTSLSSGGVRGFRSVVKEADVWRRNRQGGANGARHPRLLRARIAAAAAAGAGLSPPPPAHDRRTPI